MAAKVAQDILSIKKLDPKNGIIHLSGMALYNQGDLDNLYKSKTYVASAEEMSASIEISPRKDIAKGSFSTELEQIGDCSNQMRTFESSSS